MTVTLPDGRHGEVMRTPFDCLRCALATLASVRFAHVPPVPPPTCDEAQVWREPGRVGARVIVGGVVHGYQGECVHYHGSGRLP